MPVATYARFDCCGVHVAALTLSRAVDVVHELRDTEGGTHVHLCNAYTLSLANKDARYRESLSSAALNLPDGMPVVWAGRLGGYKGLAGPVRGMDLMLEVMRTGVGRRATHYLYGGSPETASALRQRLEDLVPGVSVVGLESPPYRPLSDAESASAIGRIKDASPDFLWVGLGTPKQDAFIATHASELGCVCLGVGAAFDFAAGTVRQAPKRLQGTGLEWMYRLLREPRRLWRRYLFGNSRFLIVTLRQLAAQRLKRRRGQRLE